MDQDVQQDYISQAVTLSAQAIFNFYVQVLSISDTIDITDSERVQNIQKLSSVVKGLVYSHTSLCEYAKVEAVRSAIKTLNGIREYFGKDETGNKEMQQECLDTLIDYLQFASRDEQLDLFNM